MYLRKLTTLLAGGALCAGVSIFSGCEVTQDDVTAAREDVREEEHETEEVRRESQEDIREERADVEEARQEVMRPNYEGDTIHEREDDGREDIREEQQDVEDAKRDANEAVDEEQRETDEARDEAERLESELNAKNARDRYLQDPKTELESLDKRINDMQERSDEAEGVAQQKIDTDIELLQVKRDNLADAIDAVEDAELKNWESRKPMVKQAQERLNVSDE